MPQTTPEAQTLTNGAFWPNVELLTFVKTYRIPTAHSHPMVEDQLYLAMSDINQQLDVWKAEQMDAGYTTLGDVPAEALGGISYLVRLYQRAVYCAAKAELLPDFATVIRKAEAENLGKEEPERAETFREFSTQAVRQIVGMSAISVELI